MRPGAGGPGPAVDEGDDIASIPVAERVSRLEENIAADGLGLSAEQVDRLDELTPPADEHHDEEQMRLIGT